MEKCATEGCRKKARNKGLCNSCYDDDQSETVSALLVSICSHNGSLQTKSMLGQIERSLDLVQGTLTERPVKSEVITLLRICERFPWIIKVAAKKYDIKEVKRSMLHAAIDVML